MGEDLRAYEAVQELPCLELGGLGNGPFTCTGPGIKQYIYSPNGFSYILTSLFVVLGLCVPVGPGPGLA